MKDKIVDWLKANRMSDDTKTRMIVADMINDCIQDLGLVDVSNLEPEAFMYQHEDTGQIGFIEEQQIEWGLMIARSASPPSGLIALRQLSH